MGEGHAEFQRALQNIKARDINEVAVNTIARLNQFPKHPRDRIVTTGGVTRDLTGGYHDTIWTETVGTLVPTYGIRLASCFELIDLFEVVTNAILTKKSIASCDTQITSLNSSIDVERSGGVKSLNALGYTYDLTQTSTSDVYALMKRISQIDFQANTYVISGFKRTDTTIHAKLSKLLDHVGVMLLIVEQIHHFVEEVNIVDYE